MGKFISLFQAAFRSVSGNFQLLVFFLLPEIHLPRDRWKIRLDFSVVNDMKYYSGIVFKGFVEGVAEGVLSGGQYDGLMQRMGKKTGAIGFAVYLDLLENMHASKANTDVDVLVLYDANTPLTLLQTTVQQAVKSGKSVSAQTQASGVRCGELIDLRKGD